MRQLTPEQKQEFDRQRELGERQKLLDIQLKAAFYDYLRNPDREQSEKLEHLMDINNNIHFLIVGKK